MSLDDHRFKILLYNLLRNSVSHTNGGYIRVTLKLLDEIRRTAKLEKIAKNQREMSKRRKQVGRNHENGMVESLKSLSDSNNSLSSEELCSVENMDDDARGTNRPSEKD